MKQNILFITIASLFSINVMADNSENINLQVETNFTLNVNGEEVEQYQGLLVENPETMMEISKYSTFYYLQEIHCKDNKYENDKSYQESKYRMKSLYIKESPEQRDAINYMFKDSLKMIKEKYVNENIGNSKEVCKSTYKEIEAMSKMMFGM